jgi:hypothetical protein
VSHLVSWLRKDHAYDFSRCRPAAHLAAGQPDAAQSQRIPTWMRMASSAVLVVAAWSWWLAGVQDKGMALLIAVGMSLGFLGDLFMAGLLPASPRVLWGMGAFGLAQSFRFVEGHRALLVPEIGLQRWADRTTRVLECQFWTLCKSYEKLRFSRFQ